MDWYRHGVLHLVRQAVKYAPTNSMQLAQFYGPLHLEAQREEE